jgi:hypothetical protein
VNDLREAILPAAREAVEDVAPGVPVEEERSDTVIAPFVWVRPADVSRGSVPTIHGMKSATMAVDVWTYEVEELHAILDALKFLDGHIVSSHGDAAGIRYTEESSTFVDEPDAYHQSILFSVTYFDTRVRTMT